MKNPIVKTKLIQWSECDIEGSLDSLIKLLQKTKKEFQKDYYDLRIETETEHGYYDDRWENFIVYGTKKVSKKKK